jgi:hypothetical protein
VNSPDIILWGLVTFVAGLNVLASVRLYGSDQLAPGQKIVQGVLVWAIPLLGALLVLVILHTADREAVPRRLRSQIDGDGFTNADGPFYGLGQGHSGHDAGGHDFGGSDGH